MQLNEPDSTISADAERTCDQEPIHLLGTVQPHGFLISVDVQSSRIVQVSSGVARHWPGLTDPLRLIGAPVFDWIERGAPLEAMTLDALPRAQPMTLPWRARFERTAPEPESPDPARWECLGHRSGDVAVLEWLPQAIYTAPSRTQERTIADIAAIIARLRQADNIEAFLEDCARIVQDFSGFDRVMIYRFLPDGCGEVVAEHTAAPYQAKYLGLRFPATDIPAQARALYLSNRLRLLADVEAAPDTLVPPPAPGADPLDQSHCVLRGLSPVHLSYLHNMGVRATLTMSIVMEARLWGLIACHHHAPKVEPYQVKEGLRQMCELTAEVANMRIETLSKLQLVAQRLELTNLLSAFHQALLLGDDIATVLRARLPALLEAFKANTLGLKIGALVYVGGPGRRPFPAQDTVAEVLTRIDAAARSPGVLRWDDLLADKQGALGCLPQAAGMLLAHRFEENMIFCFVTRAELVQQVRWAGEPRKEIVAQPDGRIVLEPRRSFTEWQQQVQGHSAPWSDVEAEALQSLLQILSDVNKLRINRNLNEKLQWRAHHDQLTGLYNRRTMEEEVTRRLKEGSFDAALMLLDLDHFKKINDAYGHAAGDQVLLEFSRRLSRVIRDCDLLGRLGGDEFMLLFQMDRADSALTLKT